MKKGKGYRFKKADANSYVFGKLATMKKAPPAEAGVQPKQDVLAAMMAGMTGNASGDNCGTGKGGFKKGNNCASGMSHITSVKGLAEALGLGGDPSNGTGGMLYTTKEYGQHEEAALEYQRQKRVAAKLGFKAKSSTAGSDGGEAVEYEHPEGHSLQVGLSNRVRHPYTHATIIHVSKAAREGLGLAEEAKKLSQKAIDATEPNIGTMSEINQALAAARRGDSKMAKNYHEAMRDYHQRATTYTTTFKKLHERAAAAHSIARDWHMDNLGVTNGKWKPVQRS